MKFAIVQQKISEISKKETPKTCRVSKFVLIFHKKLKKNIKKLRGVKSGKPADHKPFNYQLKTNKLTM